ncbi:hypothetical protein BN1002_02100 [Bacillus sp. B-jedd]|nr:hypothetical protein BN1002_02100 [Bacillus sp. B-jedd]
MLMVKVGVLKDLFCGKSKKLIRGGKGIFGGLANYDSSILSNLLSFISVFPCLPAKKSMSVLKD